MFKLIDSKFRTINPKAASELLLLNTFEGQRKLRDSSVKEYTRKMADGSFRPGEISIARLIIPKEKVNVTYLMNGQHQLSAVVKSGIHLRIAFHTYECQNRTDLTHLFASFDVHLGRGAKTIMYAARGNFENGALKACSLWALTVGGNALFFLGGGGIKPDFTLQKHDRESVPNLVQEFPDDIAWINQFFVKEAIAIRTGCAAAMIATHRVDPDRARQFWERVVFGDELKKGSPQYSLRMALESLRRTVSTQRSMIAQEYIICACWWNSFATNTPRKQVKSAHMKSVPDIEKPI